MPGRPPKPVLIHKLEGTARASRIKKRNGELQLESGPPECPEWLLPEAKEEWGRLLRDSRYASALAKADRGMVAMYCQLWARFVDGEKTNKPLGGRQLQTLVAVAAKLGLNPTDRAKVRTSQPEKTDDKWARLANR